MKINYLIWVLFFCFGLGQAQEYFPKNDGVKEDNDNYIAFTNAVIHVSPVKEINNGTLLVHKGKIVASGRGVTIPENTITYDLQGLHMYPSFIESYSAFGIEKPKGTQGRGRSPQYDASREGYYWNDHIMPENDGIEHFKYDQKSAEELRKLGFGVVNTHLMDGIARGTGVLVALNDGENDNIRILMDRSGQFFSFSKSVKSEQSYPTSLMGAMALLRQMYHDMAWYEKGGSTTKDRSLEALIENKNLIPFFEAGNKANDIRADKIGDAFSIPYVIVGGGDEYESIQAIKATQAKYIIPINFPDAYDVSDPYLTRQISLEDMREWNQAPQNPKILAENGVPFALTTHELKKIGEFSEKLQKALKYGLKKETALAALTTVPASILGKSDLIGTLEEGKIANFLITSGDIFDAETTLFENWVQGKRYVINTRDQKDISGVYSLAANGKNYTLILSGKAPKTKAEMKLGDADCDVKFEYENDWLRFAFNEKGSNLVYVATSQVPESGNTIKGRLVLPNGAETSFMASRTGDAPDKDKKEKEEKDSPIEILPLTYPNVGYGFSTKPKMENVLFKNATVWTGESEGILENTDVLVRNGKIERIGKNLSAGGAKVLDVSGKHLTAGIIDEHSHIAAQGINEAGHNSSAEVKISDVIDPEDINIYRNLAGGVTAIQILHGSANPIGGQSALIKLKWGEDADGLLIENAPKFIKFALGENVKQSNWQSFSRFPQTRMGVEQVYLNYFNRAKEYMEKKKNGGVIRYDEELEVLAEILRGERYISCHSYVQSEINMLMKVAENFGFRINTFTHILEGYKVADKMAEHGVGGSTFSDWWAYKYEVKDAIPYNAAIMARAGVTTAINSDDNEMSRRLNQEAAKTIKYGGLSEEEAWKAVTINPAKLLHLDDRTGSIKEGKDADLVVWSDHPMSVYAKAEKTMIEGTFYFDLEKDKAQREAIEKERGRLIQMMLSEKANGGKTRTPKKQDRIKFECETIN